MSGWRTRERWLLAMRSGEWKYSTTYRGYPSVNKEGVSSPVYCSQKTRDSGNPFHRKELRGKEDLGSEFQTTRRWYDSGSGGPGRLHAEYLRNTATLTGSLWTPGPPPTPTIFSDIELDMQKTQLLTLMGMGATAIARTTPTNPSVDMMTFMGESLKDGLPKVLTGQVWGGKRPPSSKASSEYLAWQFGALPFVSDLKDLGETAINQDKILAQYERDSGKNVRRKYRFDPIKTSSIKTLKGVYPYHPGIINSALVNPGDLETEVTTDREVWFSGCYTYYLALDRNTRSQLERNAQLAKRLYGIRVTPDVLYNLMPWSWAIDWLTNTGDVIQNLGAFANDGLVLRYGYVMDQQSTTVTRRFQGTGGQPSAHNLVLTDRYGVTRKSRKRATPYGFGLDPDGFTAKQVSIMAALGLQARGRNRLGSI